MRGRRVGAVILLSAMGACKADRGLLLFKVSVDAKAGPVARIAMSLPDQSDVQRRELTVTDLVPPYHLGYSVKAEGTFKVRIDGETIDGCVAAAQTVESVNVSRGQTVGPLEVTLTPPGGAACGSPSNGGGDGAAAGNGGLGGNSGVGGNGGLAGVGGLGGVSAVGGDGGIAGTGGMSTMAAGGYDGGMDVAGDGATDAPPCLTPKMMCDDKCRDPSNDDDNCGWCGHSCAGGHCASGQCVPVNVTYDYDVGFFGVDNDNVYFSTSLRRIARCPLPQGCVITPSYLVEIPGMKTIVEFAAAAGAAFWVSEGVIGNDNSKYVYVCPADGCSSSSIPTHNSSPTTISALLTSGSFVYWSSPPFGIRRCAAPGCAVEDVYPHQGSLPGWTPDSTGLFLYADGMFSWCAIADKCSSPAPVWATANVAAMTAFDGHVYWIAPAKGPPPFLDVIYSCPKESCSQPATVAKDAMGMAELVVDASGVYWTNTLNSTVRTCPLSGCGVAVSRTLAENQTNPNTLLLNHDAVFWRSSEGVMRVAK